MYRTPNLCDKKNFEIQNGGIYICVSEINFKKTGWVIKTEITTNFLLLNKILYLKE